MSHSPEPWRLDVTLVPPGVIAANGSEVDDFLSDNWPRIIACVNACWGISTDDLQRVRFYQPADGNWPIRYVDTDGITHVPCEITARHNPVLRDEQSEPCSPAEPS